MYIYIYIHTHTHTHIVLSLFGIVRTAKQQCNYKHLHIWQARIYFWRALTQSNYSDGLMVWECALTEPGIGAKLQLLDGGTCLLFRCAGPNLFQTLSMTWLVLALSFLMPKDTLCTLFFWKTMDHFLFLCTGLAKLTLLVPFLSLLVFTQAKTLTLYSCLRKNLFLTCLWKNPTQTYIMLNCIPVFTPWQSIFGLISQTESEIHLHCPGNGRIRERAWVLCS